MYRDRTRARRESASPGASVVLQRWSGVGRSSPRLCLFSHYDPQGRIDPYVFHYLHELRRAGYDLVLTSSAPSLDADDVERARALCTTILQRTNIGLDFGSWRDALMQAVPGGLTFAGVDELLLTNDSVYGPVTPLGPIIDAMRQRPCDFWGTTDSFQMGHHVQSYFLVLRRPVLESPAFRRFWEDFLYFRNKDNVIRDCEIGLSRRLTLDGFRFDAFCRARDLAETEARTPPDSDLIDPRARGRALRSSTPITHWQALLLAHGYPFLKRELVRDNPDHLPSVASVPAVLAQIGSYDVNLVLAHLRRLGYPPPF